MDAKTIGNVMLVLEVTLNIAAGNPRLGGLGRGGRAR